MDSPGRALNNIRCERFWRSVKYEEVFLKKYETVRQTLHVEVVLYVKK